MLQVMRHGTLLFVFFLSLFPVVICGTNSSGTSQKFAGSTNDTCGKEHFAIRDGLRIYLWEKYRPSLEHTYSRTGNVALLVHGGTWSGRSDFDLQVRDYSLMDFLAKNGYDVWAIDIHGYGHSDKTEKDWSDARSAAEDINTAADYITKLRGVERVDILGWSAGTQRAGLFAMQHPEKVAALILYAPIWKGNAEYKVSLQRRIENNGQPLGHYRTNTKEAARNDFIAGDLALHPQFEEDVVEAYAKEALRTDPQSPNSFIEFVNLPILDPARITVPTMIIHGERDFFAHEEDLLPFYALLGTHDKRYILLPNGGHALILEKDHRRFQYEVLNFFDHHEERHGGSP